MKLGTLKSDRPDGHLVVVSSDNQSYVSAQAIVGNLREAVEQWGQVSDGLQKLYDDLNAGRAEGASEMNQSLFHSPLPRTWGWLDGSAYIHHIILVRKARNAEPPKTLYTVPLMYQGGSDTFLAPNDAIPMVDFGHGVDFEGEVGVVTSFVPMGTKAADAEKYIRLFMIINDVSLRGLIPGELAQGFGFMQSKPSSAFAPFAVTPNELGDAFKDGRIHLPLLVEYNGEFFGDADAGHMHFSFGQLIEHAARTRNLSAGTIIGSGTVSNVDTARGSSCLAEKRMLEKINQGEFITPFMNVGDRIRIEMKNAEGDSIFGVIDQRVVQAPVTEG